MRTTLTAMRINVAIRTCEPVNLNDPVTPGLNIRIGKKRATWTWLGRDSQARVRRFTLGHWPHIGLAEARRLARAMSHEAPRGMDLVREARARCAAVKIPKGHTLAGLLDLYGRQVGEDIESWAPQMQPQIKRVFRPHLDTPLANLTIGVLQMAVDNYPKPKSASYGVRCLLPVLRWASAPGRAYIDRALLDLRTSAKRPSRDRVLSRDELAKLLPTLSASDSSYAKGMRFIVLTACRRGEVSAARWGDIDFAARTWTLPRTKNGTEHVIPLSGQAIALLRAHRPEHSDDPSTFVFNANGKPLADWEGATERLQKVSATSGWTRHDLRRTAATLMGNLGVMPDIIEATLNHVTIRSQVATIYNKSRYRPEVALALQRLADELDDIEHGGVEVVAQSLRGNIFASQSAKYRQTGDVRGTPREYSRPFAIVLRDARGGFGV
jgi:integrase